eukprot:gene19108-22884_t
MAAQLAASKHFSLLKEEASKGIAQTEEEEGAFSEEEDPTSEGSQEFPSKKQRQDHAVDGDGANQKDSKSSMDREQQDTSTSSSSPQMNSKRLLLIKPPRSPAITSRTKPVLVGSSQNTLSPSITCITSPKPLGSPPINSMSRGQANSPSMANLQAQHQQYQQQQLQLQQQQQMKSHPTGSPTILPTKMPQNVMSALLQKKGALPQVSPSLTSKAPPLAQSSPMINPKTPITLSIPRFKKQAQPGGASASPSITSTTAAPPQQSPLQVSSPFHLPQYRKGVFPPSPLLTNVGINRMPNASPMRVPQSPLMPLGMTHNNVDPSNLTPKQHPQQQGVDGDESGPNMANNMPTMNANGTPILTQGYPFVPYFPIPPFSLNSSVNMETTFNSPFAGKLSVKGSLEVGFQIECNIMGKSFSGYLTEGPPLAQPLAPPPVPPQVAFKAAPTMPPHPYDANFLEAYRHWQEAMFKVSGGSGQHQLPNRGMPMAPTTPNLAFSNASGINNTEGGHSSTTSTPLQAPKTPSITVHVAKDDSLTDTASNATITTASTQPLSENSSFQAFRQNAFQKLEQYQKLQILNMQSKQEESIASLLETFERDKAAAGSDEKQLARVHQSLKEAQDQLAASHRDARAKLDATHGHQASKFHREVEKQWHFQNANKADNSGNRGANPSPLGSPTLTPFISPSPAPSPSLQAFIGTSPMITPASLSKSHAPAPPSTSNSSDHLPPLSLSSNSPPRSPAGHGDAKLTLPPKFPPKEFANPTTSTNRIPSISPPNNFSNNSSSSNNITNSPRTQELNKQDEEGAPPQSRGSTNIVSIES